MFLRLSKPKLPIIDYENDEDEEEDAEWLDSHDSPSTSDVPAKRALSSAILASPLSFSSNRLQEELLRLRAMQPHTSTTRKDARPFDPYQEEALDEGIQASLIKLSSPRLPSTLSTHGVVMLADSTVNSTLSSFRDKKRAMSGAALLDQIRAVDDLRQGQGQGSGTGGLGHNQASSSQHSSGSPRVAPLNLSKLSCPSPPVPADRDAPSSPLSTASQLYGDASSPSTSVNHARAPSQDSSFSLLPLIPGASPRGRMGQVKPPLEVRIQAEDALAASPIASPRGRMGQSQPKASDADHAGLLVSRSSQSLTLGTTPRSSSVSSSYSPLASRPSPPSSTLRLKPVREATQSFSSPAQSFSCPSSPKDTPKDSPKGGKSLWAKLAAMRQLPAEVGTTSVASGFSREGIQSSKGSSPIEASSPRNNLDSPRSPEA